MMKYIKLFFFFLLLSNPVLTEEIKEVSDDEVNYLLNNLYSYDKENWFGAYVKDQSGNDIKIGYAKTKIERIENENKDKLFVLKFYWFINFKSYGLDSTFEVNASEIYQAEPPYNFLNSSSYTAGDGMRNSTIITLKNKELLYLELDNDTIIELENKNIEFNLKDVVTFEALAIKDELKEGDVYYTKALDSVDLNLEKNTVLEVNDATIDGVLQKYYKIETIMIIDGKEEPTIMYGNANQIISFDLDLGDGFIINTRLESKDEATDLSYVADLYILNSIHLDEIFHDKNTIGEIINIAQNENSYIDYLNFEITGEYDDSIDENYNNQKIINQDDKVFLNLGYNYNFDPELVVEEYYEEAFNYTLDNPKLNSIATDAITNSADKYDEIEKLMTWINDNIYQFAEIEEITDPYEILERGGGDCTEISDLFNSLLKSIGVPARTVTGYVYGFEDYSFGGHQWSEVEINGKWVPVDATWNMWVESSPFHIKVRDYENSAKDFTKKYKLNIKKAQFSNGKIINYNENGTQTIN